MILENINGSDDLKSLNSNEKVLLCEEIRKEIIDVVSENGGHLASNLGVVELTVALFSVFNMPKDTIVWDVGHQCYTHKLLSGRQELFKGLRKKGGASGFPNIKESDYDMFTTGHSSTAISSSLGISLANQIKQDDSYTVAVVGDGALTGGLCYEALNNAGRLKKNFIVIINDNNMSISKNVGAMSRYLTFMRVRKGYIRIKKRIKYTFEHIPLIGKGLTNFTKGVKTSIKKAFYNSTIFEDMGFAYYGPYDGHDLPFLEEILTSAKEINKPVLIHVMTKKGKGYEHAETNPKDFHGVPKFNPTSGIVESSQESFSSVFGDALVDIAKEDEKVCALTAAMVVGTGLSEFSKKFKNRFFDVGIAEAHAVTFASGLSRKGLIPVFAVYSTFLQRAYDSLIHDIALQETKLVLCIDRAGVVGDDGRTHQGVFDVNFLKGIPNTTVFSPCYYDELRYALLSAVKDNFSLVAIRYPRGKSGYKPDAYVFKGEDYRVFGNVNAKFCIVTYGRVFCEVIKAVQDTGIPVKVIKLNQIIPIPIEAIKEVAKAEEVLFIEEAVEGVASKFCVELMELGFCGKYKVNDIKDGFVGHDTMQNQLKTLKFEYEEILKMIKESQG